MAQQQRPLFLALLVGIFSATGYFSYKLYNTYYGSSFSQSYSGYFDFIGDLNIGHAIKIHGFSVGRVVGVGLSPDQKGIVVSFVVDKNIVLYDDVSLSIEQGLLMGDPCISIKPGSSKIPLSPKTVIENTSPPLQIFSLVEKFMSSGLIKKDNTENKNTPGSLPPS